MSKFLIFLQPQTRAYSWALNSSISSDWDFFIFCVPEPFQQRLVHSIKVMLPLPFGFATTTCLKVRNYFVFQNWNQSCSRDFKISRKFRHCRTISTFKLTNEVVLFPYWEIRSSLDIFMLLYNLRSVKLTSGTTMSSLKTQFHVGLV